MDVKMDSGNIDLDKISELFLNEALSAPNLFSDLAKVELYIAESYRTRSFIEMIQNADDARATVFKIESFGDCLTITNNGDLFTSTDIISLCRSGSSTKQRGDGRIGYRGIGFKSVAGIAKQIKIISGRTGFYFSKEKTKSVLDINTDVPLIRIPYKLTEEDISTSKNGETHFIFSDLDNRVIDDEIKDFDVASMLFLSHINRITIKTKSFHLDCEKSILNDGVVELKINGNVTSRWLIKGQSSSRIGLKIDGVDIVPASDEESKIHSFLPTNEFAGANLKINGDFSTDPSRKSVDFDERSLLALHDCAMLIFDLIVDSLNRKINFGVFSPFTSTKKGDKSRKLLLGELKELFKTKFSLNEKSICLLDYKLKPDWFNQNDFVENIDNNFILSRELSGDFPELHAFLKILGAEVLTLHQMMDYLDIEKTSKLGKVELISRFSSHHRFDMPEPLLSKIKKLKFIPIENSNRCVASFDVNDKSKIDQEFIGLLHSSPYWNDISVLLKRLSINQYMIKNENTQSKKLIENSVEKSHISIHKPSLMKWRSAEVNVKEWFSSHPKVLTSKDVSKSNVGYDIEVKFKNGDEYYVEVKSVSSFNEPFEITNNEYAIGSQLKEKYIIACVCSGSESVMNVMFIKNPIKHLFFEKRIKSISWLCEDYIQHLSDSLEGVL